MADSRALNFEHYGQPSQFKTHYVVERGARIRDLMQPTIAKLRTIHRDTTVVVKIAAGINDITRIVRTEHDKFLRPSTRSADEIFIELCTFKDLLKRERRNILVGLVTIPTVSVRKYAEINGYRATEELERDFSQDQREIDDNLQTINYRIRGENRQPQLDFPRGPRTVSWHSSVTRKSFRKSRNKNKPGKPTTRSSFGQLYDGIHAVSQLKRKWFHQLITAFTAEIRTTSDKLGIAQK